MGAGLRPQCSQISALRQRYCEDAVKGSLS